MASARPVVTLRLPFEVRTKRPAELRPPSGPPATEAGDPPPPAPVTVAEAAVPVMAAAPVQSTAPPAPVAAPPAAPPAADAADGVPEASATLVWLAFTSTLTARATTLEDAALAALEGRL